MRRAVRAGCVRGLIELRQSFTSAADLWGHFFWPALMLVALFFLQKKTFAATTWSLGALGLPGMLAMNLATNGLLTTAALLAMEREDGTLLRSKAIPHGMSGYLIGKVVFVGGSLIVDLLVVLIPGAFIVGGVSVRAETLPWVLALGMVATIPIGAVLGAVTANARNLNLLLLPIFGLTAVSGIFYPITALPGWLQGIAQVFPLYWLGLGMRSALLPAGAAAVEIGQSWRHLETIGVLAVWSALGLLLAPGMLRRMARRESGSSVAARRDKAMQRVN
ncbi:ABC transporter permease [Fodinicola acaciae]|uniref:ABC transporter permease n=1 Tax=Fodinicola acaciae TaxID=2681555 RepID=UPI0013D12344|nr:ABC transporter permease [Fodinicola acaciae]